MSDDKVTNFVFDSFDLGDERLQTWDGQGAGPPEIPLGEYMFEAVECELAATKKGDGQNIVVTWEVAEGDYAGKRCKQWYLASGQSMQDGNKRRLKHVFAYALGLAAAGKLTPSGGFASADVIGRRMYATVSHETSLVEKPNVQTGAVDVKEYANIRLSQERPLDSQPGDGTAATPTPPVTSPTAPPPRPPQASSAPPPKPPTGGQRPPSGPAPRSTRAQ